MSVRKRGTRYQIRVSVGGGQRVEKTLPAGTTRAQAREVEAALVSRQIQLATNRREQKSIDDALDRWETTEATQLKSWAKDLSYRVALVRKYTAGRPLEDLPAVAAQLIDAGRIAHLSSAAINRYLAILRRVARLAERWDWTQQHLSRRIAMLPGERARHVYLTAEQVAALADAAGDEAGDAIRFAALTGLRRGELLGLTREQLLGNVVVLSSNTKSGRPRSVPLTAEAVAIAQARLPWQLGAAGLRKAWDRARIACGLPHARFHDLRHTYASWLVQSGAGLTHVRDLLGHSSLAVTSRYSHLATDDLRQAVSRLPWVRAGSEGKR